MDISVPYYEDKTRISNSAIGWFLNKGPAFLHKMLTEDVPEEKSTALERGTMIHEYILQPEEFQKDYVVWDKSRPSSVQQEKFCQELASSTEIEPNRAILNAYKEAYSTAGKSDDKMLLDGLKIASTLKDYIDFLKQNDGRTMISPWDVKMLEKIKYNIRSHKLAKQLIVTPYIGTTKPFLDEPEKGTVMNVVYHEFHINWEWSNGVKCKSLLDSLSLDFVHKKAVISDLKTTQKLWHFEESMETYNYLRQLTFYMWATKWYLDNECGEDSTKWDFEFYIVAIDTTGSYDIRVFKFGIVDTIQSGVKITDALDNIKWHQTNDKWDHSREYYEGDGSESLNL